MGGDPRRIIIEAAAKLRLDAAEATGRAHNWFVRRWIYLKALFGFHG